LPPPGDTSPAAEGASGASRASFTIKDAVYGTVSAIGIFWGILNGMPWMSKEQTAKQFSILERDVGKLESAGALLTAEGKDLRSRVTICEAKVAALEAYVYPTARRPPLR
jgi:hypothetical protein